MNKEELLEAIEQKRQAIWPTDTGEMKPATVPNNLESGWLNALYWMENLINSLPAEQPSEELVDAARNIRDTLYLKEGKRDEYGNPYFLQDTLLEAAIAGANWQKEQIINKASQWLNENVVEYHPRKGELRPIVNINAFREAMVKEDEQ